VENRKKTKNLKTDVLRSIGKQPGDRIVSPEEEKKATVGRICRKGSFSAWNERVRE